MSGFRRPRGPIGFGRWVLDRDGNLHPFRRRYHVEVVAIVTVKPVRRKPATDIVETVRGQVARIAAASAPARRAKIDLNGIPSSMELRAASWKGKT